MRAALTPRQREILTLLAAGLTTIEVAERLVLSKHTVDAHIRNMLGRLGARSRTHALALALRRREIRLPS
jgi:DNA-binding CsgD family transcriptional regulator